MRLLGLVLLVVLAAGIYFFINNKIESNTVLALNSKPQRNGWFTNWWLVRHEEKIEEMKNRRNVIELAFLGDSIIHSWEHQGKAAWDIYYEPRNAVNLGFGADLTEHVLWRIENGGLSYMSPKVLVLMIGTNNTGHRQDPAEHTAQGIKAIIDKIRQQLPNTKILLLAIFPRGADDLDPKRQINQQINQIIQHYADNEHIFWLNINANFLDENRILSRQVSPDLLHLSADQYEVWAQAIEPFLIEHL